jgi:probable O-glycosylation ligase (exosortase A-associated)
VIACLLANQRVVPWLQRQFLPIALILAYMALWVPFARNNYFAYAVFKSTLQTWLFAIAFASFVNTTARLSRAMQIWVLIMAFQALWGITHGGHGNGNFAYDENEFALLMNVAIPFAVFGARAQKSQLWKWLFRCVAALCVCGVVASNSRGGLVGLVAVTAFAVLTSPHGARMLLATLVAAGLFVAIAPAAYWNEMRTIFDPDDTTRVGRQRHWRHGAEMWKANPILGVGQGNYPWNVHFYEKFDHTTQSQGGRASHSLYFTLLPELGLVGVALYAALLCFCVADLWHVIAPAGAAPGLRLDGYARAILAAFIAYLSTGIFLSVLYYPYVYYFAGMTFAIRRIADSTKRMKASA